VNGDDGIAGVSPRDAPRGQPSGGDRLALYEELAFDLNDGDNGNFLSGWQCENPFVEKLLADVRDRSNHIDHRKYVYFDDDDDLAEMIRAFHTTIDRQTPEAILCGSGSTALLFAVVTHLHASGLKRIYYVPPLYFTLHRAFGWFGIEAQPVSALQPFEAGFELELPTDSNSVLFLADPVWYAGKAVPHDAVEAIAEWQRRTGSIVVVDGSLQYLGWSDTAGEATARLDPSRTLRLICPSKQLCVHGYRFSYLLLPSASERSVAWTYSNIAGPAGADSLAFAHEAMAALATNDISKKLVGVAMDRHRRLRAGNIIASDVSPDAGYFVFERITVPLPVGYKLVDGRFFDQPNYPDRAKINLLSPSMDLLMRYLSSPLVGEAQE
jgi:histidinol-phosphate/aromatic aminotransferase/cobyric acid decarboxylase-like protein